MIDTTHINSAVFALVHGMDSNPSPEFVQGLKQSFELSKPFDEKVKFLDDLLAQYPPFGELSEVLFDLMLVRFLHADAVLLDPDYLESEEWSEIEDRYLSRGTEMLNIFLYLQECIDEKLDPDLDDFLQEFLLVEDDNFSEEQAIYEPFIENADLIDAEVIEVIQAYQQIENDHPVKEIFIPFMLFFMNDISLEERLSILRKQLQNAELSSAYLCCLDKYYQS